MPIVTFCAVAHKKRDCGALSAVAAQPVGPKRNSRNQTQRSGVSVEANAGPIGVKRSGRN